MTEFFVDNDTSPEEEKNALGVPLLHLEYVFSHR